MPQINVYIKGRTMEKVVLEQARRQNSEGKKYTLPSLIREAVEDKYGT